ncbi:hypothetical protein CK203_054275 [Vitis vinifera]|uniref:Uncharacterized protein n=1 Tax=Vitis vinifera TaxID=29760 RepID=A0A438GY54_VITVI|nr:hypothetical protein CK203_054275 [Vitis vinifera]
MDNLECCEGVDQSTRSPGGLENRAELLGSASKAKDISSILNIWFLRLPMPADIVDGLLLLGDGQRNRTALIAHSDTARYMYISPLGWGLLKMGWLHKIMFNSFQSVLAIVRPPVRSSFRIARRRGRNSSMKRAMKRP